MSDHLFQHLEEAYLLSEMADPLGGEKKLVRLAHDTLVPPIHIAYERSTLPGQNAERILSNIDFRDWRKTPERYLLNEEQVQTLKAGRKGMRTWSPEEAELVQYSQKAIQKREQGRKILRIAIASVVVIIAALMAFLYQAERKKRKIVEANSLEAQADLSANPTIARDLLEQSLAIIPNVPERMQKLADVTSQNIFYNLVLEEADLLQATFSDNGRYMAIERGSGASFEVKRYEYREGEWIALQKSSIQTW